MKTQKFTIHQMTACAIVAALYAAITIISAPLSYGLIQFRISEALIVLCWFEPVLAIGITLGCLLANLFSTVTVLDIIIGTIATALACFLTIRCKKTWLIPLPNIIVNAVLVGAMLAFVLFPGNFAIGFITAFLQVGFGEAVVMYLLGLPLLVFLKKTHVMNVIFHKPIDTTFHE